MATGAELKQLVRKGLKNQDRNNSNQGARLKEAARQQDDDFSFRDVARQFLSGATPIETIGRPENIPESAARAAGQTLTTALGGAAGAGRLALSRFGQISRVPEGFIGAARQGIREFTEQVGRQASRRPGTFLSAETAAGAGAGAGAGIAQNIAPDSDAARFTGEVLGGTAASGPGLVVPLVQVSRTAGGVVTRLPGIRQLVGKTFKPRETRAAERFQRATEAPGEARRAIEESDTLEGLTPAQKSGDRGLLELERSVMESSDKLRRQRDDQIAEMTDIIRDSLREVGGDVPVERTRETFGELQEHLTSLLNTRLRIAAQRVDERLQRITPKASRERANLIAREELNKALRDARSQERELFAQIPGDVEMPTSAARRALREEMAQLGKDQLEDIPRQARRRLSPSSTGFLGKTASLKDMRSLQSKLREQARHARSSGERNSARIADKVADAITEDISRIPQIARPTLKPEDVPERVNTAVSFSRELNERFNRGVTGRLLRRAREGGDQVPEGLTLERALTGGGPQSREAFRQLRNAVQQRPEALDGAVEDFVKDEFLRTAFPNDQLKEQAARRFIARNQDLIDEFPSLRQDLEAAVEARSADSVLRRRVDSIASRLRNPRVSKTALLLREKPDVVFNRIADARRPAQEMQRVINNTKRDKTGEALQGLKTAYVDRLLSRSERTVGGEEIISGDRVRRIMESEQPIINKLFSKGERDRIQTIVNTAEAIDRARGARESLEGVIGDLPGKFSNILSRVLAARTGGQVGQQSAGGSLQTAQIFSGEAAKRLERFVSDPAKRLITDAVQDEELFKDVLMGELSPGHELSRQTAKRLNGWLGVVAADIGLPVFSDDEGFGSQ